MTEMTIVGIKTKANEAFLYVDESDPNAGALDYCGWEE